MPAAPPRRQFLARLVAFALPTAALALAAPAAIASEATVYQCTQAVGVAPERWAALDLLQRIDGNQDRVHTERCYDGSGGGGGIYVTSDWSYSHIPGNTVGAFRLAAPPDTTFVGGSAWRWPSYRYRADWPNEHPYDSWAAGYRLTDDYGNVIERCGASGAFPYPNPSRQHVRPAACAGQQPDDAARL